MPLIAVMITAFSDFRRNRPDLTLDATASLFKVNRTTILRWEKGEVPLPVKRLSEISTITGISRERLRPDIFGTSEAAA